MPIINMGKSSQVYRESSLPLQNIKRTVSKQFDVGKIDIKLDKQKQYLQSDLKSTISSLHIIFLVDSRRCKCVLLTVNLIVLVERNFTSIKILYLKSLIATDMS